MRFFSLLFLLATLAYPNLNQGSAFKAFFWFSYANDSVKNGCYGYVQVDSVKDTETEEQCYATFWLTYNWFFLKFNGAYMPVKMTFNKTRPKKITRSPNHFINIQWFSRFETNDTINHSAINFSFPILSRPSQYGRYDYFTVDVDSLLDLEFYGAGDSIMVGTFVHKKPSGSGITNILGRNTFVVELTDSNPLRIKSVRCQSAHDSLLDLYLKFPLDSLKKNVEWYGVDILDTISKIPRIKIYALNLSGKEPHIVGTQSDITWKLDNKPGIDSCLVTVSFDRLTWESIGKTLVDTLIPWNINYRSTPATILQVVACGKNGERISTTRTDMNFSKAVLRSLQLR
ncbi:MAG: hypothetical protein PHF86_10890 [Candidatus Nanoarchaeia archaeon]|jgi:hypothetical protein|nr:hypothetical protein [Candidatus Nanoarchaeia archaeon]